MGAGGDCAGWEATFSLPSSFLHWQVSVLESWSQSSKNKKASGHNKAPHYLQRAGLPAGKRAPGRGCSTQPEVRWPASFGPERGAMFRGQAAPGGPQRSGTFFITWACSCRIGNLSRPRSPGLFSALSFCSGFLPYDSEDPLPLPPHL